MNTEENKTTQTTGQEVDEKALLEARLADLEAETQGLTADLEPNVTANRQKLEKLEKRMASIEMQTKETFRQVGRILEIADDVQSDIETLRSFQAANKEARERGKIGFHPKTWGNLFSTPKIVPDEKAEKFGVVRRPDGVKIGVAAVLTYGTVKGVQRTRQFIRDRRAANIQIDDGGDAEMF